MKRAERVPVVALRTWAEPERLPVRLGLPAKRREYRGRPLLVTMKGQSAFRLLWSTAIGPLTVLAAAEFGAAWEGTAVQVVEHGIVRQAHRWSAWDAAGNLTADGERSERWHIARAIETAKVAAAVIRERVAPDASRTAETWLRQQLATLDTHDDDEEEGA